MSGGMKKETQDMATNCKTVELKLLVFLLHHLQTDYKTRPIRWHHSIDIIEEKDIDHAGGEVDGEDERAKGATKRELHSKNAEVC